MLLQALSALLLTAAAQAEAPSPSLQRHPRADLLIALRGRCPPKEPKVRAARPDELLRLETGFRDQLSAPDRSRLDQARTRAQRKGGARCGAKSGASCQADAGLSAVVDSDLMGAFAEYVCARETAAAAPR